MITRSASVTLHLTSLLTLTQVHAKSQPAGIYHLPLSVSPIVAQGPNPGPTDTPEPFAYTLTPANFFPPLPIRIQCSPLVMMSTISPLKRCPKTSQETSLKMKIILLLVAGLGRSGNVPITWIGARSTFVCSVFFYRSV
ncbi:hypothetical protein BDR03DRAFT_440190 [Suillus americanus]|nr:hypothetical protein BDR03DRAFT_440190 [Suillus americanus]